MDEKGWEIWKKKLPKSHEWACSCAIKDKKREGKRRFYNRLEKGMLKDVS